jgi:hypothetical protein
MTFFEKLSREPTDQVALPEETLLQDVSRLLADPAGLVDYCKSQPERLGWAALRLCDSSSSNCLRLLTEPSLPLETRYQLTEMLKNLFSELFDQHCEKVLHRSLNPHQHLNMACSLFWDFAPLGPKTAGPAGISQACADVIRFQLTLANPACRESGLLGIEQWIDAEPSLMATVLKNYDVNGEPIAALRKLAVSLIELLDNKPDF